ncbi:hypothetical protein [Rubinisphaera sp.]|uniref:hypothetical protein n=1 Tax=Rubinisphaera sp. TaxID=2024857 RepID=UPI000C0D5E9D|nr:hypothetical protein [Rubinisphaera sp.]MBV11254.1 hypothetical protein [Rubinisphaera sp.]HCS52410.1 hypothetical protein [Planctomycetaceae bacterium]
MNQPIVKAANLHYGDEQSFVLRHDWINWSESSTTFDVTLIIAMRDSVLKGMLIVPSPYGLRGAP